MYVIILIKLRRIIEAVYSTRMILKTEPCRVLVEKLEARNYLEGLGVGGITILKWILNNYNGRVWTGFIWLRI
jgi:hypothetical protein